MCELFAISSKIPTTVAISLEQFSRHGGQTGPHIDGWGLAFYEGVYAQVFREAEPAAFSELMRFLQTHPRHSQCVISHIRLATQGSRSLRNTQPFSRELGGQRHVFCHNGDLQDVTLRIKPVNYAAIGETDSEYAFCYLMSKIENIWKAGPDNLEQRRNTVKTVFDELAELGPANFLYSDGDYLYAYANERRQPNGRMQPPGMYYLCRSCNGDKDAQPLTGVKLNSDKKLDQDLVLFASVPLSNENWIPVESNQLIVTAEGQIVA